MSEKAVFPTGEGNNVDVTAAIKWLNAAVITNIGHALREPEIVILKGTWRGLTYEQMSNGSDYSTNYLMRDVAPKLWKQLSHVFGHSVGKTNFRVALESYVSANADIEPALATYGLVKSGFSNAFTADFQETASADAGLFWHPAVASDPRSTVGPSTSSYVLSGEGRYGDGLSTMPVPPKMYGYAEELCQARQWVMAAALGARPGTRNARTAADIQSEAGEFKAGDSKTGDPEAGGSEARDSEAGNSEYHKITEGGHCRLVGIWGLGGVGKTLLAKTLVAQVGEQFEGVIWRSLKDKPTLDDLCSSILMGLGVMPALGQATVQLLSVLSQKSILLVLDGIESILQSGQLAGEYQAGYQAYDEFFQSAAGLLGCIVVTGIEGPAALRRERGYSRRPQVDSPCVIAQDASSQDANPEGVGVQSVGSLTLGQLSEPAAISLLQAESLTEIERWPDLIARYQGHPLALKSAARVIREIFGGHVAAFLAHTAVLFTDISRLLAPSFQRISAAEESLLYWLASQEASLSLEALHRLLPLPISLSELVSVLDSLKQRSLLTIYLGGEIREEPLSVSPSGSSLVSSSPSPKFCLSPLVKAYSIQQFMAQFSEGDLDEGGLALGGLAQDGLAQSSNRPVPSPFNRGLNHSQTESSQVEHQATRLEPIINLSAGTIAPVQLDRWLQGQFEPDWQALGSLFALSAQPEMRLRSVYHWREAAFVKRCKFIDLGENVSQDLVNKILLLVAIQKESETLYKVCVQAQPTYTASVLPVALTISLLAVQKESPQKVQQETQQTALASVIAQQNDSFIQLPYFRGSRSERFEIEIILGEHHHTERFII